MAHDNGLRNHTHGRTERGVRLGFEGGCQLHSATWWRNRVALARGFCLRFSCTAAAVRAFYELKHTQ